ncbi:MAG TPA: site-2 protease family protein [Phototrophicaceae bacterium]|nr:site-2 protease family protein [Phototrophicaceae bacterium]
MLLFGDLSLQMAIATLLAVLAGMTIHEFAHNYVGHLMGDPNPARMGKLTLNPLAHINPLGFLMFALIGFGVLGQAPVAAHRMRNPRWGYMASVAAGPLSNLLLAVVVALLLRLTGINPYRIWMIVFSGVTTSPLETLALLLGQVVFWNVLLFVFNLLPVFPIDGWHIVLALLPPDLAYTWQKYAQTTNYILFGLIILSFLRIPGLNILSLIVFQPAYSIATTLMGL